MPRKVATEPSVSIIFPPVEFCKCITYYVSNHPIFCTLVSISIIMIYLILFNPNKYSNKALQILASLPCEKLFNHCKSQKMITVYATMVEIAFELFMAIVLAGVSLVITIWIAFEEKTERKNGDLSYESKKTSSKTESYNDVAIESLPKEPHET